MKLQLNDSNKTIICSIDTVINRKGEFSEYLGYYYVINVNGLSLIYSGNKAASKSQKDYDKLYKKGGEKVFKSVTSEIESGWAEGVYNDCNNPEKHGHVTCSILCSNGTKSGIFVWDYNLKKSVLKSELTSIE